MKYQIALHGWPVGQHLIPVGTILVFAKFDDWTQLAGRRAPPRNAMPLDQQAYDVMREHYADIDIALVGEKVVRRRN